MPEPRIEPLIAYGSRARLCADLASLDGGQVYRALFIALAFLDDDVVDRVVDAVLYSSSSSTSSSGQSSPSSSTDAV